jgi:hypothetical protein
MCTNNNYYVTQILVLHILLVLQIYRAFGRSLCTYKKMLEVISSSVYTGLDPFNFIRKHSLQICVRKVAVHL